MGVGSSKMVMMLRCLQSADPGVTSLGLPGLVLGVLFLRVLTSSIRWSFFNYDIFPSFQFTLNLVPNKSCSALRPNYPQLQMKVIYILWWPLTNWHSVWTWHSWCDKLTVGLKSNKGVHGKEIRNVIRFPLKTQTYLNPSSHMTLSLVLSRCSVLSENMT